MPDPLALLSPGSFPIAWALTLLGLAASWWAQVALGRRLFAGPASRGIVSLELAGTEAETRAIFEGWGPEGRRRASLLVWLDFALIAAYAPTLAHACGWAGRQVGPAWGWPEGLATLAGWAAWVAAACDVAENVAMLRQLPDRPTPGVSRLAKASALAKFGLIGLALAYAACGVYAWYDPLTALPKYAAGHLGVVLALALLFGMVFGLVGVGNGLPSLFWHDRPWTRLSASCAATLLLLDIGVISYYEQRDVPAPTPIRAGENPRNDAASGAELVRSLAGPKPWGEDRQPSGVENVDYLGRFLGLIGVPFLLLLAAPALAPKLFPSLPEMPLVLKASPKGRPHRLLGRRAGAAVWVGGIGLGVAIAWLLLALGRVFRQYVVGGEGVVLSLGTFYLLYIVVYAAMGWPLYRLVSPAAALCALIAFGVMLYALVSYFDDRFFPILQGWWISPRLALGLALAAVFGWANLDPYKLRFPAMEDYDPKGSHGPVDLREAVGRIYQTGGGAAPAAPGPGEATLLDDRAVLERWKASAPRPLGSALPRLAVVIISGGATRSAYWGATVLDRIASAEVVPDFARSVRIIAGASGGMVAAGFAVRELSDRLDDPERTPLPFAGRIPSDSIRPVARFIALREVWRALLPIRWKHDRGVILEENWGPIRRPLQDFQAREAEGAIPSIILSPMMIEDGRRLLISNLFDLRAIVAAEGGAITEGNPGLGAKPYSLSALEFFRIFPLARRFALSTGVRMSASFPYVSPAVNLPTVPPRRVVDAGYYDNYGVQVASAWIRQNLDWLLDNTSGVALIQIRDAISIKDRLEVADAPSGTFARLASGFQFFTSPPGAAGKARTAASAFQNDQEVRNLSDQFTRRRLKPGEDGDPAAVARARSFFTTAIFENSAIVEFGPGRPDAWPGEHGPEDRPSRQVRPTDVALDWYLSQAERDGLDGAIPTPRPGSKWAVEQDRLDHIVWLRGQVAATYGLERDLWLKKLEQVRNYEKLVNLKAWWEAT